MVWNNLIIQSRKRLDLLHFVVRQILIHRFSQSCLMVLLLCWGPQTVLAEAVTTLVQESNMVQASHSDLYEQAVTALATKQYTQARRLLEQVVQASPAHAGAWLDLALLYCELGDADTRESIFRKIENELYPPASIQALIQLQRNHSCVRHSAWRQQIQVGWGHASNVNYAPTDPLVRFSNQVPFAELLLANRNRPQGDGYLFSELQAILPISDANWAGAQWHGLLQYKKYQAQTDYDTLLLSGGALWQGLWSNQGINLPQQLFESWELGAYVSALQLGGAAYENASYLWINNWSKEKAVWSGAASTWRWGLEAGLSAYQYPQTASYNALRADLKWRNQWQFKWLDQAHTVTMTLGLLHDSDVHNRPGGTRSGVTSLLQWQAQWNARSQTVAYLQHQYLRDQMVYNELFFGSVRREPLYWTAGVRYSYALSSKQQVLLFANYQQSRDHLSIFSYKNQNVMLSFQQQF